MKTLKKITVEPVYLDVLPEITELEEGKIYISRLYSTSVHLCLCGCRELTVLPFTSAGWRLTETAGKISITPSILQTFGCRSHYIITKSIANFV